MAARMSVFARSASYKQLSSGLRSIKKRCFSSSSGQGSENICDISLAHPVPWIPAPKYATITKGTHDTKVTTLDNGLRIATQEHFGQFCTVGVVIDSGSRYEVAYPSGIAHFLEKLAFASTTEYRDRDSMLQMLEKHGGICDCQGSRDTLIYAVSADIAGIDNVIHLLSEVILRPKITEEELIDSQMAVQFELESLDMRPDPEPLLVELIHAAAYRENTLGLPKISPEESIRNIDKSLLYTYFDNYHSPERMVLAGVGVDHDLLVNLAQKHFANKKPIWQEEPGLIDRSRGMDLSVSQYTGGIIAEEKDLSDVSLGPTPMPELAHCVIGLESCSHKDPDFIAFCVLNMMMGGGGSFSAGGPGKGMYTRLYLNVLNRYHWMYNATAYNHAYNDSGLFCVHASAHPNSLKDLVSVIVREIVNTAGKVSEIELNRAKTQLQSMLMMNLESRAVIFEDVGRQVLANGHRKCPEYFFEEIAKITEKDINRVAKRMLRSKPAVAAYGGLNNLPYYEDIQAAMASRDGKMPRKFSLFN